MILMSRMRLKNSIDWRVTVGILDWRILLSMLDLHMFHLPTRTIFLAHQRKLDELLGKEPLSR